MSVKKLASELENKGFTIENINTTGSSVIALKAKKDNEKVLIQRCQEEIVGERVITNPFEFKNKETASTSKEVAEKLLNNL